MSQVQEYIENVDPKWAEPFQKLKKVIEDNIPEGFVCEMQYGMPSYVVPLSTYPDGYHCAKDTPLPFLSIAAKKIISLFIIWGYTVMKNY